jgi:4Fe-4S ferredoxin
MPFKTLKTETSEALALEWILHVKNYKLNLDKNLCVGCEICTFACPKEAIKLEKQSKRPEEKARHAKVDINLGKCNFCGICDILCPYGAIKVTLDGKHDLSVLSKESFPQLVRDIQVDTTKCTEDCIKCEEACPLHLIKVTRFTADGKPLEDVTGLTESEKRNLQIKVEIQKERCPCCRICEIKCPEGAIHVRAAFYGKMLIYPEKCPEGCTDCLDVCPITGALYFSEGDRKVHVNEMFCVYCGACKLVCPVNEALELKRTKINHTPVKSGAWNKALERLASPLEITKELKAKGSTKAKESVDRRLGYEVK